MKFLKMAKWLTDKYILIMLSLFPLFVGIRLNAYKNITAAKFYFFAIATGCWIVLTAALLIIGVIRKERYTFEVRFAHLGVALFLMIGGLSSCLSEYGSQCFIGANRYTGYLTYIMYALIFFGVSWLSEPKKRYFWAMGIAVTICCTIALLQLAGLDPFWLYPTGTNYYDKYVAYNSAFLGTIGNTGLLSAYMCLTGPTLLAFSLSSKKADRFLLLPGVLAIIILLCCDVDAGLVALAGCVLISVPMLLPSRKGRKLAAGISGGITITGLAGLYFWPGKSGTLYEASQLLHGHLADEFGSHRGQIWKRCWELFLEKPWLGGGPGTAALRINILWYSDVRDQTVQVNNAHNVYLGYLIDIGIPGLFCYLASIVCSLITWFRRRGNALYAALGCGLLCYWIQDLFGLGLVLTAPMMWVIWGLLESSLPEENKPIEIL